MPRSGDAGQACRLTGKIVVGHLASTIGAFRRDAHTNRHFYARDGRQVSNTSLHLERCLNGGVGRFERRQRFVGPRAEDGATAGLDRALDALATAFRNTGGFLPIEFFVQTRVAGNAGGENGTERARLHHRFFNV